MNAPSEKSVAQVLRDAAAIVEHGWCQGMFRSGKDRCASGAIADAAGVDVQVGELWNEPAWRFFGEFTGSDYVSRWNDEKGRTKAEVIAKLLEAADVAERKRA